MSLGLGSCRRTAAKSYKAHSAILIRAVAAGGAPKANCSANFGGPVSLPNLWHLASPWPTNSQHADRLLATGLQRARPPAITRHHARDHSGSLLRTPTSEQGTPLSCEVSWPSACTNDSALCDRLAPPTCYTEHGTPHLMKLHVLRHALMAVPRPLCLPPGLPAASQHGAPSTCEAVWPPHMH